MKTSIQDIKETVERHREMLQQTYHLDSVGVFGSVARGDNTEQSDIDMLVQFSKPVGMFTFLQLENYLSDLCGEKVELVTKKALKPFIKEEILREVIYV